jgi:hypothetical protein
MNNHSNRPVKTPSGNFIGELSLRIRLIMRLMADKRVFPLLKLIPVGTLLYLAIPDLMIGPLDDAAVIGIGMGIFVELCPQYVVDEHMRALHATVSKPNPPSEDILEGEFREADPPSPSDNGHVKERHER